MTWLIITDDYEQLKDYEITKFLFLLLCCVVHCFLTLPTIKYQMQFVQ